MGEFWSGVFGAWADLPWWLRLGIAGVCLLISTVLFFAGTFWPWGWAVGIVLLMFGGKSDSEKKGYRF